MKNSNSSITADSRHTPRTHHNPSHGASPVSTPQALQTRWVDQINRIALADADAADRGGPRRDRLDHAQGRASRVQRPVGA